MTTFAVQHLAESDRPALTGHFLGLSVQDRRLRFGVPLARTGIVSYVDRIDFGRDALFGFLDEPSGLVGVVHVAIVDGVAELGLSVLGSHRGLGIGAMLFQTAAIYLRQRRVSRLVLHFLAENAAIARIARRFDMTIVSSAGESDAYFELMRTAEGDTASTREAYPRAA